MKRNKLIASLMYLPIPAIGSAINLAYIFFNQKQIEQYSGKIMSKYLLYAMLLFVCGFFSSFIFLHY